MEAGDWVQSILSGMGILATLGVAWMVYRLESRDRRNQRAVDEATERTAREEVQERERRAIRRERHKDDYKAAIDALDSLEKGFREAARSPVTEERLDALGFSRAAEVVERIATRVPELRKPLHQVWLNASMLEVRPWPKMSSFEFALRNSDALKEELPRLLLEVVSIGNAQNEYGKAGMGAVAEARKAISQEWGS